MRIRLLDPTPQGPKPAMLYLHGGGWTLFSIDTHDRIMREYAARGGNRGDRCRLHPVAGSEVPPGAGGDRGGGVHWLRTNGASVGVDFKRLAIGGDSAGAAMTIAACMMLRDAGEPAAISAMLLNYGAFDAACDTESFRKYGEGGYLWDPGEMQAFWKNYLRDERDATNPLACPLNADVKGLPPAFLAIPECDVMYDESVEMGERLRRAGGARADGDLSGRDSQLPGRPWPLPASPIGRSSKPPGGSPTSSRSNRRLAPPLRCGACRRPSSKRGSAASSASHAGLQTPPPPPPPMAGGSGETGGGRARLVALEQEQAVLDIADQQRAGGQEGVDAPRAFRARRVGRR